MSGFYDPRERDRSLSRRPQNRRDDEWIRALLLRSRIARIATLWQAEDGQAWPFITPLAYAYRPDAGGELGDLVYHTNVVGRLRANTAQAHPVTVEVSEIGHFLPSNSPLELTVQYRSVIVFGQARVLEGEAAREALTTLSERIFEGLKIGETTRPISDEDLSRTSVYSLAVERWSGKENWAAEAIQEDGWPALGPEWAARP